MSAQENIKQRIEKLLQLMGISGRVVIEDRDGKLVFNIRSDDSPMLIGQYGVNMMALQHLVRLLARRALPADQSHPEFIIDVEDYRKNRDEFLIELATQAAARVRETGQALMLKPMSSYDRFVIHTQLSASADLISESTGEEPERRIVIKLKQ